MSKIISFKISDIEDLLNITSTTTGLPRLYYNNLKTFSSYIEEKYGIKEFTNTDTFFSYANLFFKHLFELNLSVHSVNRHLAAINYYLKIVGIKERLKFFKVSSLSRDIDKEYEQKIVNILSKRIKIKDRLIIYLFIYEGFTSEDVCNLKCEDINLDNDTIKYCDYNIVMHPIVKQCYLDYIKSRFYKRNEYNYIFYYRSQMTPSGISRIINKYDLEPRKLRNMFYSKITALTVENDSVVDNGVIKMIDKHNPIIFNYIEEIEYCS